MWVVSVLCLNTIIYQTSYALDSSSINWQTYLESLIEHAETKNLAASRTWHVLLHYRANSFSSGVTSEVDGSEFFLAQEGKTKPAAELEATLRAFFSDEEIGKEKLTPQCAFPARYHWLDSQLKFNSLMMPVNRCETLEKWRKEVDPESVSLIFSSYFLNNPASMFGHTLLRFNRKGDDSPGLLDYAINYSADPEGESNPLVYVWKGVTGGFQGRFAINRYYDIVKQYNDIDNRDLWEYRLNLSPDQIDMLLLHLWEISKTNFDYFFFRENCSYHLLSMLEVADPELQLREEFWAWTLPTETIKRVSDTPELVESVTRRPSLSSQINQSLKLMTDEERAYLKELIEIDQEKLPIFNLLPPERQAFITDTAINFLHYQNNDRNPGLDKKKMYSLLLQRSQLPGSKSQVSTVPGLVSPDKGHDPARFEITGGEFQSDGRFPEASRKSFVELSIQPGFHSLLSLEDGHAPNSQINYLNLEMRYESKSQEWRLQKFNLVEIISLYPLNLLNYEPSWKIVAGWERNRDYSCANCLPFIINFGLGTAYQSSLFNREVYFGFLDINFESDHELNSGYRAGFGTTVGLLFDITHHWRIALTGNFKQFTSGEKGSVNRVELRQRYYLSRNLEVIFDIKSAGKYREGKLGIAYYF